MSTPTYGSITLVDIGDLGELSVIPESNQPTMVIYDPESNTYTPNWSTSNLILTPVVYYGSQKLLDGNASSMPTGLTVTWQRQIGSDTPGASGGTVSYGKLTVNSNPFNLTTNTLVTYIVNVQYTEPNLGAQLNARGQITYGLIQNAAKLKKVNITGSNAFLYNSSGTCLNSTIVLTAATQNVSITKWQYKNSSDIWVDITNSASTSLTINDTDATYFNNDVATFRVITSDANVYDDFTILKIRDGAPGDAVNSIVLSNESQMVPCDQNNNPVTGAFTNCTTTITIYEGNEDKTSEWTITIPELAQGGTSHGVTGTFDNTTYVFTANGLTATTGYITFVCTKNQATLTKTYSLVKVKAGADGESPIIYSLEVDTLAINKSSATTPVMTPASITLHAYSYIGNTRSTYQGIFKIYIDGSSTAAYISANAEATKTYTIANTVNNQLKLELYSSDGNTLYDTQTVVITSDGAIGQNGEGGLNFILGNYSDVIPCSADGLVAEVTTVTIPFTAYKGTSQIGCTAAYTILPNGMELVSNTAGTTTTNGSLVFSIRQNASLGSPSILTGQITVTLTADGKTSQQTYTWTKNIKALDGNDAVVFSLYAPNGNVISNKANNVVIKPQLMEGTADKGISSTFEWYYWNGSSYVTCTGATGYTVTNLQLTVAPAAVSTYVSIKCTATYNSNMYDAYISIYDRTDTYQITVISTLGDKLINSEGMGIIYTRVSKNGTLFDEIMSTAVSTSNTAAALNSAVAQAGVTGAAPSSYCWYVTSSTIALYKKNGNTWSAMASSADPCEASYSWSGIHVGTTGSATIKGWGKNKAILINGNIVNKKTMFNVTMTV